MELAGVAKRGCLDLKLNPSPGQILLSFANPKKLEVNPIIIIILFIQPILF